MRIKKTTKKQKDDLTTRQLCAKEILFVSDFFFRYKIVLWITGAVTLLTFGIKIVWFDYSIDTEVAMSNYQYLVHSWTTVNRFGVVLIKKLLFPSMFNPYLANVLTYVTLFLVTVMLCLLLYRAATKGGREVSLVSLIFFSTLFVSSPIIAEMFNFISLSFEICLGMLFVVMSVYSSILSWEYRKWWLVVIAALFATFAFSVYQALPAFYVACAAATLVLLVGFQDLKFGLKEFWKYVALLVVVFAISMLIYEALPHAYGLLRGSVQSGDYLSKQVMWGMLPQGEVIRGIKEAILGILFAKGYFYSYALLTGIVLSVIGAAANYRRHDDPRQVALLVSLITLLLSPFLLLIVLGSGGVLRNNMPTLQLVTAFLFFYAFQAIKPKQIKLVVTVLAFGFSFWQLTTTSNVLFLEHMKYEEDVALTTRIITRLDQLGFSDYRNYNLAVAGTHQPSTPHNVRYNRAGEPSFNVALDKSFYEWDNTSPVGVSNRVAGFMVSQGYPFKTWDLTSEHELQLAKRSMKKGATLAEWPSKGSVEVDDTTKVVIINL